MSWADRVERHEVKDIYSFTTYACQETGTPYPAKTHLYAARKAVDELFNLYPTLTWQGLCGLVQWAKDNNKRYPHILQLLNGYRYAYADGYLDEIRPPSDENIDSKIAQALLTETDPEWRLRLMRASGPGRKIVYAAWLKGIKL